VCDETTHAANSSVSSQSPTSTGWIDPLIQTYTSHYCSVYYPVHSPVHWLVHCSVHYSVHCPPCLLSCPLDCSLPCSLPCSLSCLLIHTQSTHTHTGGIIACLIKFGPTHHNPRDKCDTLRVSRSLSASLTTGKRRLPPLPVGR
jgi:hypothetical protein